MLLVLVFIYAQTEPNAGLVEAIQRAGIIGLLSFIVVGAVREWWVPGSRYRSDIEQLRAERDRALEIVQQQQEAARRALDVALLKGDGA